MMSREWHARRVPGGISLGEEWSYTRRVVMINPTERTAYDGWGRGGKTPRTQSYVLWFGAYGSTRLHVFAPSLEDALDAAIDWLAEHAPGHLCDDEVNEEYARLIADGVDEETAIDRAECDTTSGGNAGNRIHSWEWGIALAMDGHDTKTFYNYITGKP